MKKQTLPLNPPRPGPGQFSFGQFLEWAAANNRSPVALPRFSPYAKPRRELVGLLPRPPKTVAADATAAPDGKIPVSDELAAIVRSKPWWVDE